MVNERAHKLDNFGQAERATSAYTTKTRSGPLGVKISIFESEPLIVKTADSESEPGD